LELLLDAGKPGGELIGQLLRTLRLGSVPFLRHLHGSNLIAALLTLQLQALQLLLKICPHLAKLIPIGALPKSFINRLHTSLKGLKLLTQALEASLQLSKLLGGLALGKACLEPSLELAKAAMVRIALALKCFNVRAQYGGRARPHPVPGCGIGSLGCPR
jgi:hypothetical protein